MSVTAIRRCPWHFGRQLRQPVGRILHEAVIWGIEHRLDELAQRCGQHAAVSQFDKRARPVLRQLQEPFHEPHAYSPAIESDLEGLDLVVLKEYFEPIP